MDLIITECVRDQNGTSMKYLDKVNENQLHRNKLILIRQIK